MAWRPGRFALEAKTAAAIARSNRLTLTNLNRDAVPFNTGYGFKVRHVRLGIRFEDGSELICPVRDPSVITCADDWLHREGRRVPLGEDLAWTIDVP